MKKKKKSTARRRPRQPTSPKLSDTRVYEPQTRARLGTTAQEHEPASEPLHKIARLSVQQEQHPNRMFAKVDKSTFTQDPTVGNP